MKDSVDDWGPTVYALLQHGIRPWEFGELTIPALEAIARKGERARPPEEMRRVADRARKTLDDFMKRIAPDA